MLFQLLPYPIFFLIIYKENEFVSFYDKRDPNPFLTQMAKKNASQSIVKLYANIWNNDHLGLQRLTWSKLYFWNITTFERHPYFIINIDKNMWIILIWGLLCCLNFQYKNFIYFNNIHQKAFKNFKPSVRLTPKLVLTPL